MIRWIFLGLILASTKHVNALDIHESFYCSPDDQYIYKNISCCLPRISKSKCETLVDLYLDSALLKTVEQVISDIESEKWLWGNFPNCFWGALSFNSPSIAQDPHALTSFELENQLSTDYLSLDADQLQAGDIVIFDENYMVWDRGMDNSLVWGRVSDSANHAAVYLEEDYLFQKESVLNQVFSIDTRQHIYENITNWIKRVAHTKEHEVTLRYYRFLGP